jgi:hypothetical protein
MKRRVKRHTVSQPLDKPYRFIPLTQGQNAIVDVEDFEYLSQWNWCAVRTHTSRKFYALRCKQGIRMHRFILDCKPEEEGDHKNGDGLDNRRENLRKCTVAQNAWNRKIRKTNISGYKGISFHKEFGPKPWEASLGFKGRHIYIGLFSTREEAAHAYDKAAKQFHGEFAHLNFPQL